VAMHAGKLVIAQVMEFAPWHPCRRLVAKYRGDFNVRTLNCLDQFLCMAFAQLTYRESMRDIEAYLGAQPAKLYHLGVRGKVNRSNLADANETRDWRIHCEFAQALIRIAQRPYAEDPLGVNLDSMVYALDSTTIDLCLSLFPWVPFREEACRSEFGHGHKLIIPISIGPRIAQYCSCANSHFKRRKTSRVCSAAQS